MKMKVGEIEFDSESTVSFGGRESATGGPRGDLPSKAPTGEARFDRIDRRARRILALVGMLLAGVTGALALAGTLSGQVWLLGLAGFALLAATSCLVAYLGIGLKTFFGSDESGAERADSPGELGHERASRLSKVISDEPVTVDRLLERTGWTEASLLPALARLVADGEVDEDLDLDTGAWTYRTASPELLTAEPPRHTLSLDDRIESIADRTKQPVTHEKEQ